MKRIAFIGMDLSKRRVYSLLLLFGLLFQANHIYAATNPYTIGNKLTKCKDLQEAAAIMKEHGFKSVATANTEVALFRNSNDYLDPVSFYIVSRKDGSIAIVSADVPVLHMGDAVDLLKKWGYTFMFEDRVKNAKGILIKRMAHYSNAGWVLTEFNVNEDIMHSSNFVTFCCQKPETDMYHLMNKAIQGDITGMASMMNVSTIVNDTDNSYAQNEQDKKQLESQKQEKGKKEQAAKDLKESEDEEQNSTKCYNTAKDFIKKKDYKNAAAWYLKSILCDGPKSFMSKYYLGQLYMEGGNGLKANYTQGAYWLYNALNEAEVEKKRVFDYSKTFSNVINYTTILQTIEDYKAKGYINDDVFDSFKAIDEKIQKQLPPNVDRITFVTKERQENTYAIVISNEDYKYESPVPFASRDGSVFADYCNKILGIPEENILKCNNASYNHMSSTLQWLREKLSGKKEGQTVLFYYAGHGIPDESDHSAYLLPVDGFGNDPGSGISLKQLCSDLGEMVNGRVILLLDACFSGTERSGKMMDSASRGVAIKVKPNETPENVVVFSASQGDQTAYPYDKKKHGLFTYFLLEKLMQSKGEATMEQLKGYVTPMVKEYSTKLNNKEQIPSISQSTSKTNWKGWKLK